MDEGYDKVKMKRCAEFKCASLVMFGVVTAVFGLGCPIFCLACVLEPIATEMPTSV